jgi:hypothetical protein
VPTIIVNGDGRYFASPAGRPSHVSYATAHQAQQYAEQRAADLHRTVMDFLMASGSSLPCPVDAVVLRRTADLVPYANGSILTYRRRAGNDRNRMQAWRRWDAKPIRKAFLTRDNQRL